MELLVAVRQGDVVVLVSPLRSITDLAPTTQVSFPAAAAAVDALVGLGVAREFTGRRRDRLFVYDHYVAILGEGTEVAADR